jgi:hypothetical protein
MRFGSWLKWIPLAAAPMMLISGMAVAQKDDLCFIQTSSGQRIALDKFCGKSGDKAVSNFMWDESNYDPSYVSKNAFGIWQVRLGGPHPFKYPDGGIIWPDGRATEPDGTTTSLVKNADGSIRAVQYYREDQITPLKPGETIKLPSGLVITQQSM